MPSISAGSSPRRSQGWGGPALLESYDLERRPASARAAEVSFQNYRRLVSAEQRAEIYSADARKARPRAARSASGWSRRTRSPGIRSACILATSITRRRSWCRTARRSPPDDTFGYQPTAFPGARAPHVWLAPGAIDCSICSATGFVLLKFGDAPTGRDRARGREPRRAAAPCIGSSNEQAAALYGRRAGAGAARRPRRLARRADPDAPLDLIDTVRGAGPGIAARSAPATLPSGPSPDP